MKKGWFELDKYKQDDCYCSDCCHTWKIHIYSYEDEDVSTPDVTLTLNKTNEAGSGYFLMEFSMTYVGRAILFDEVIALVKKLDEICNNHDSLSLTDHLVVCREFFDCGKRLETTTKFK
jgi:hypothetical protein